MSDEQEYEVLRLFVTSWTATCTLNYEHMIRRGEKVARVQRADNPMLPVPGVACQKCWRMMRSAGG